MAISGKTLLLVDIGRTEVRWCSAVRKASSLELVDVQAVRLPAGEDQRPQAVQAALRQAVSGTGVAYPTVLTALPKNLVLLRVIDAPKVSTKDLRKILALRVAREVPNFNPDQVRWDYELVQGQSGSRSLILSAVREEALTKFLADFHAAGIEPAVVDVEPLALARWYGCSHFRSGTVALIDIGHQNSSVALLTDGVTRHFGQAPLSYADLRNGDSAHSRFVLEVQTALHAFNGTEPHPSEVIICGSTRLTENLGEMVGMQLGARVTHLSEVISHQGSPLIPPSRLEGNSHVLESLAWRAIQKPSKLTNLLAQKPRKSLHLSGLLEKAISLPAIVAATIMLMIGFYFATDWMRRHRTEMIEQSLAAVRPLEPQLLGLEKTVNVLRAYEKERFNWLEILAEINKIKPENMMLSQLKMDRSGKCSLSGEVNGKTPIQVVEQFVTKLNESKHFESVQMGSIRPKQDNASFQVAFTLSKTRGKKG